MPSKRPIVAQKVVRARSYWSGHRGKSRSKRWPSALTAIPPTQTTEKDMVEWIDWFARFHSDPAGLHVPYAIRSVDCRVEADEQPPVLHRCVREVAKFNGAKGTEWSVLTWVPGLPGVQFQPCASLDDAMRVLENPEPTIRFLPAAASKAPSAHP